MNLYLVSQSTNTGWDTYDSFVCRAPNEEVARNMSPSEGDPINWSDEDSLSFTWCRKVSDVEVVFLGKAVDNTKQGVVCASFYAG